ncbi:MAG: DUF5665 domain-containing protein [Patescibacteria group bacterium]
MAEESNDILEVGYDKDETQQQRLITVLNELEDEVEKQNSWRHVFVRGTLYGLGTVIGATLLLAVLGSMIALAVETLGIGNVPYLGDFVRNIVVEQINKQ